MKVLVFSIIFLCTSAIKGQTVEKSSTTSPSSLIGLSISGHAYPTFFNGENHQSFMVQYGVSKVTQIELQGFYDTYLLSERFRTNMVGKVYLTNKLYLFLGMEVEAETGNYGNVPTPYRLGFVAGTGYDFNENFMIEVKSNVQLNNSRIGVFGESLIEMPAVYTIGSKFKF